MRDIEDIRRDYNAGNYRCNVTVPRPVPEGYVFDENLSVKRNREMVEDHNKKVVEIRKEKDQRNAALFSQMRNEIVEYIKGTYNMNAEQAKRIESWVFTEKHAFMCDYFPAIDEIAALVEEVINMK